MADEKIEINAFLGQLISALNKKFEAITEDIKTVKRDVDTLKQAQARGDEPVKALDAKMKNLEFSVNSLRNKSQIDRSLLRPLEGEKQ